MAAALQAANRKSQNVEAIGSGIARISVKSLSKGEKLLEISLAYARMAARR